MSKARLPAFSNEEHSNFHRRSTLWDFLNKHYNLLESKNIETFFSSIKFNYQYLQDFITFAKLRDEKICLAAIPVDDLCGIAKIDLDRCLEAYSHDPKYPILYIYFNTDDERHGNSFKEIYLMFFCQDEKSLLELFLKFEKLKAFI